MPEFMVQSACGKHHGLNRKNIPSEHRVGICMTPIFRALGTSFAIPVLAAGIAVAQTAQEGGPAPAVSVQNLAGDRISIHDMEGQGSPIFLFFINTQDNTSSSAANYIDKIAAAYVPSKTKWFGICNGPVDRVRAWQSELNPPYQVLVDPTLSSMQSFRAQSSPTIVEIGNDGTIMHVFTGYSASMLKKLNRTVAAANGVRPMRIDFSKAPGTTQFGNPYIGRQPGSGPGGGG